MEPVAYRIREFCRIYVISRTALYREVKAGRLRILKPGKRSLIERAEAERLFASLREK
ncbi:MAG: DNA-binding protein [Alphaproteobacteria bacterium]|nr:DNA-binding protein [Alphaproteobacteria bacterium]